MRSSSTLVVALVAVACGGDPTGGPTTEGGESGTDPGTATAATTNDTGQPQPIPLGPSDAMLVPTNEVTCADGYPVQINPTFPQPFTGQGSPDCTLVTYSNVQPPGSGTVVSATIGVGPITGPMRFVRMRILAEQVTGTACCSAEQFGEVFTPGANGLTTVPLNLAIEWGTDVETGIQFNDWVGLEVLAPNVPIPGIWTNDGGADLALPDYLWLPALSSRGLGAPTPNLRSEGSFSGFVPTFNLGFVPAG